MRVDIIDQKLSLHTSMKQVVARDAAKAETFFKLWNLTWRLIIFHGVKLSA